MALSSDVEFHIRQNFPYSKVPEAVKKSVGSQREWEKAVFHFSVKNQLRWKGNIVRHVRKDERKYYEELIQHSREHLMLFPYHLSDIMVRKLRFTPFRYYLLIMQDTMEAEKSYDSLPNFTAADGLRLLGIGRNQYIDLMNQCRSKGKFFRRGKPVQALLPSRPVEQQRIESWWVVFLGFVTEDDIKMCSPDEVKVIDSIIDVGPRVAGHVDRQAVLKLHNKGLIYLDIPLEDGDYIIVPPLEGFVMNRVQGDYFETLMYKIFVSIAEHTTIAELASILQIDLQLVKNAVSVFIRLGFALKRGAGIDTDSLHPTWQDYESDIKVKEGPMLLDVISETGIHRSSPSIERRRLAPAGEAPGEYRKRIGFLFDSTLTAFLMMGNLSQGLKSHAVTMFEVGKLADESMDSFLTELDKVDAQSTSEGAEGEAQRYFRHAITLNHTLQFLRFNPKVCPSPGSCASEEGVGLDLLRCESLNSLDAASCSRLLNNNYSLLVSMAPLSHEIQPVSSVRPTHMGPAIAEVSSVWFKLWLYNELKDGPPSLLIVKGTHLRKLPSIFQPYQWLLITTWGHDPTVVAASNVLLALNDALSHSAVLLQAYGQEDEGAVLHVPFPLDEKHLGDGVFSRETPWCHKAMRVISQSLDVQHSCGYITMLHMGSRRITTASEEATISTQESQSSTAAPSPRQLLLQEDDETTVRRQLVYREEEWVPLEVCFGIPLFDSELNDAILQKFVEFQLCKEESLKQLLSSSRLLSLRLLHFISQHQNSPLGHDLGLDTVPGSQGDSVREMPLPTWNLIFSDGQLRRYDVR